MSDTTTIEIFRVGAHLAGNGKTYTFSRADLEATAAAYSPAVFNAPIVIGHPKANDPAYGWADALRVEDDVLVADVSQVEPAFAEMVNAGRFKKISPWFWPPAHPRNPSPGVYYPRHLGVLGAAAPGCQGLQPISFSEEDEADLLAFASDEDLRPLVYFARNVGRVFGALREWLIEKEGREAADKVLPSYDADWPAEVAGQLDAALKVGVGPRFAEGEPGPVADPDPAEPDTAFVERQAELDAREQALAAREAEVAAQAAEQAAAFAEGERQGRAGEDAVWIEGLVSAGKLPPAQAARVAAICDRLHDGEPIAFAEGGEAENLREGFKAFLDGLGVVIRFDEIAGGDGLKFAEPGADDFAARLDAEMSAAEAAGSPIGSAEAARRARAKA